MRGPTSAEAIATARRDVDAAQELLAAAQSELRRSVRVAIAVDAWRWSDVGRLLGTTAQSAHERFGPAAPRRRPTRPVKGRPPGRA